MKDSGNPRGCVGVYGLHLCTPLHDGGSIRTAQFHRILSQRVDAELVARTSVIGANGHTLHHHRGGATSKTLAALRTICWQSHYVRERHVGSGCLKYLDANQHRYGAIYANFVWTIGLPGMKKCRYLDTHNAEAEWFDNIAAGSKSALVKYVCKLSKQYSLRALRRMGSQMRLVHVSARDAEWYRSVCPQATHVILPNGCNIYHRANAGCPGPRRKMYFLGSLAFQMNVDALNFFARAFWPKLRETCEFHVFGSNPVKEIVELCQCNGWALAANLSDAELDTKLVNFEFAVMPFERVAGSKLKFYDALARGMYVLATSATAASMDALPASVIVSDRAEEWADVARKWPSLNSSAIDRSQSYAKRYSWDSLVGKFLDEDPGALGVMWRGGDCRVSS